MVFDISIHSSIVSQIIAFPKFFNDSLIISSLSRSLACLSNSISTFSQSSFDVVTRIALASLSCSAWDIKSAATCTGSDFSSATTSISLGPAIISMSTCPNTIFLAVATNIFPGPTILSTLLIVSVPYAKAAIACAPPTLYILSTPAILAATPI